MNLKPVKQILRFPSRHAQARIGKSLWHKAFRQNSQKYKNHNAAETAVNARTSSAHVHCDSRLPASAGRSAG